jgi:DNA modification methylase
VARVETIGRATLYLGDCRDILPTLQPVDAVVSDPPYGIGEAAGKAKTRRGLGPTRDYGNDTWDNAPIDEKLLEQVKRAGKWSVLFGGNYYALPPSSCWLVWDKVNGENDFADCELAWTNLPKAVRRIRYMWNGMLRENGAQRGDHPTQKPLEVMKWAIGHIPPPAETILDPFMGSGTTGVAAIQMGRAFIGIEREERYFEAAVRRMREANGDDLGPLFGEAA